MDIRAAASDMQYELSSLGYPLMCIRVKESQHIWCNRKGNLLGFTWLQCYLTKSLQLFLRTYNRCLAIRYIELHHLLTCTCTCVGNRYCDLVTIQCSFAVCKCRITQAKTKWISRFALRWVDGILRSYDIRRASKSWIIPQHAYGTNC